MTYECCMLRNSSKKNEDPADRFSLKHDARELRSLIIVGEGMPMARCFGTMLMTSNDGIHASAPCNCFEVITGVKKGHPSPRPCGIFEGDSIFFYPFWDAHYKGAIIPKPLSQFDSKSRKIPPHLYLEGLSANGK